MCSLFFYHIGNFVSYMIKKLRQDTHSREKEYVASDRARRENVARRILFYGDEENGRRMYISSLL